MMRDLATVHRLGAGLGAVLLALGWTGCGGVGADYSKLDLVSVGGTITLDGTPLVGATVKFEEPNGSFSFGRTDGSGHYSLMFNTEKSGVLTGPKTVRVQSKGGLGEAGGALFEEEDEGPSEEDAEAGTANREEKIPACYNKESKLKVEITASATIDFDLQGDCSVTGPTG